MNRNTDTVMIAASMDDAGRRGIVYGIKTSEVCSRNLLIFSVYPEEDTTKQSKYDEEFNKFVSQICSKENFLNYRIVIGKGYLPEAAASYSLENPVSCAIFGIEPPSGFKPFYGVKFIKATKKMLCPFLTVKDDTPSTDLFKYIYIPISHKKEEKEKLIWAETFFKDKNISIKLIPAKAEEALAKNVINNHLSFACRQFESSKIPYEIIHGTKSSYNIDQEVIKMVNKNRDGIVVVMTTKHYGPEQEIFGPPELKTIINKENIPILCVNPRTDLHVMYSKV